MSLPGPEHSSRAVLAPAALAHLVEPHRGLERPDQHRGGLALGLAHRVQQAVDPVREVHVGDARPTEQDGVSLRAPDVRVARWVVGVVALDLDDHASDAAEPQRTPDQIARHVVHRAREERSSSGSPASAAPLTSAGAAPGPSLRPRELAQRAPRRLELLLDAW